MQALGNRIRGGVHIRKGVIQVQSRGCRFYGVGVMVHGTVLAGIDRVRVYELQV